MKISARNVLRGKVVSIKPGPVTSQVSLDVGGGNVITSTVTSEAVAELGIEVGGDAFAVIKASQVMLAVD